MGEEFLHGKTKRYRQLQKELGEALQSREKAIIQTAHGAGAAAGGALGIGGAVAANKALNKRQDAMSIEDVEKIAFTLGSIRSAGNAALSMARNYGDDAVKAGKKFVSKAPSKMDDAADIVKKSDKVVKETVNNTKANDISGFKKMKKFMGDATNSNVRKAEGLKGNAMSKGPLTKNTLDDLNKGIRTAKWDRTKARGSIVGVGAMSAASTKMTNQSDNERIERKMKDLNP